MGALLGLDQLQSGPDGIGGGIGGTAQQSVGVAHLHQHGAEVVALGQGLPAVVGGHLALAQLHHLLHHFLHGGVSSRVENFQALDVEVTGLGGDGDFLYVAHQNGGQEAVLLQTGSGLQDTGVGAFGKDDLPGICFQGLDHRFKHDVTTPYNRAQCP